MAFSIDAISITHPGELGYNSSISTPAAIAAGQSLIIFLTTPAGGFGTAKPNVTVGGQAAIFMGSTAATNSSGTLFAYKILNPPTGATVPVVVSYPNAYFGPIHIGIAKVSGATNFGFFDAKSAEKGVILSGVTTETGGKVLTYGFGHYVTPNNPTSAFGPVTQEAADNTDSGHSIKAASVPYTAAGQAVTFQWTSDYNVINACAIEIAGSAGPPKQTLSVTGIGSTEVVSRPLVKDPNVQALGPDDILNVSVLGSHTISRQAVGYYELNGTGNVATGSPAVVVERTSGASNYRNSRGSIPVASGEKKYWEITVSAIADTSIPAIGIGVAAAPLDMQLGGFQSDALSWDASGGARDSNTGMNGRPTYVAGDVLMMAVDMSNGWIFMGKNGQWYNGTQAGNVNFSSGDGRVNNTARSPATPLYPFVQTQNVGDKLTTNFGRSAFAYAPPAGFTGLDNGVSAPPKQTLSVSGIASTEALGTHAISNKSLVLLMAGLLNASTLGSPAVVQLVKPASIVNTSLLGAVSIPSKLNAPGIAPTASMGSPVVTATYGFAVPGIQNLSVLGDPTLKATYALPMTGIANASLLGVHAVGLGINVSSLVNFSFFGTPTVNQGIKAPAIEGISELGSPQIKAGRVDLSPAGILSQGDTGGASIHYKVNPSGIANVSIMGEQFITHIYEGAGIYPSSITNVSAFGEAKINQTVKVNGILADAPLFGSATVYSVPKLLMEGLLNLSVFGQAKVRLNVNAPSIENTSEIGIHALKLVLSPDGYLSSSALGMPSVQTSIRSFIEGILNQTDLGSHAVSIQSLAGTVFWDKDSLQIGDPNAVVLTEGNKLVTNNSYYAYLTTNVGHNEGKYYFEINGYGDYTFEAGVSRPSAGRSAIEYAVSEFGRYRDTVNGTEDRYFPDPNGHVPTSMMFALDIDAGLMWIGKDGVWSGEPGVSGGLPILPGEYFPAVVLDQAYARGRFADGDFLHSRPALFQAWQEPSNRQKLHVSSIENLSVLGIPLVALPTWDLEPEGISPSSLLGTPVIKLLGFPTSQYINVNGEWWNVEATFVRHQGEWKELLSVLEKVDGNWVRIM